MKLSQEEQEALFNIVNHTDSAELIEYFENQKTEQQKRDNINLIVSVIAMLASVISVVIGLIK